MKQSSFLLGFALLSAPALVLASPITTYTQVDVSSGTSVNDALPNLVRSDTGATVSIAPVGGTRNGAFDNGSGGFTVKTITDLVSGVASLETATLKSFASGGYGSNGTVRGVPLTPAPGRLNGVASSNVSFGDSFRTFADNQPYLWRDGDTVQFSFGVTGSTSVPGNLNNVNSQVLSRLKLNIFQPGTIDLLNQFDTFDFSGDFTAKFARFNALSQEITARTITRSFWYLGSPQYAAFDIPPETIVTFIGDTPVILEFDFAPGGDFDWVLFLDNGFQLDRTLENTFVELDFANSAVATYRGLPGTTTYSASGLFPNTLNLANAPTNNPVPTPATLPLLAAGLLAMAALRNRSRC
jgi:hypothetical protein